MKGRILKGTAVAAVAAVIVLASGPSVSAGLGEISGKYSTMSQINGLGIQPMVGAGQCKPSGLGIQPLRVSQERSTTISLQHELIANLLSILLGLR